MINVVAELNADGNAYYASTAAEHEQNLVEAGLR